jgi:RHS repeat-associated protein
MYDETVSGRLFGYNLRFPGQYFDVETGKHYNYFRDYDPSIGRYVESDPIGMWAGWNTYAYVTNSPVGRYDSFGLFDLGDWFIDQLGKARGKAVAKGASSVYGTEKGKECAKDCKPLNNPRQAREEAITEICNRLIPEEISRGMASGADAFHTCRDVCEKLARECDKKPCPK